MIVSCNIWVVHHISGPKRTACRRYGSSYAAGYSRMRVTEITMHVWVRMLLIRRIGILRRLIG